MIVATPKTEAELEDLANTIARSICTYTIDQRADLFHAIARNLEMKYTQGYTGRLFHTLAEQS